MIVYGRNAVREAVRGPRNVARVWATERVIGNLPKGAPVQMAGAAEIEERCGSPDHQGVCAAVAPYPYAHPMRLLSGEEPLIIALDEVTDPQNFGAICRSAECAGASGIVIPERRSVEVTPAVCKASAGAVEHVRIARVRNLIDFFTEAKRAGCWIYGAAGAARTPYDKPDYTGGVVLVLGAEGKGLRPRVQSVCDDLIALPLKGRIASLNVSAATAVLLYEVLQQRERA